ncbi:MAG: hypothetical protein BVN35_08115 [Proteobacteria bacterium ST_bin11]|nr:MAG: hypothetical protein BVN35_08115 [Proteobacteria bacterium ST_bin11]
MNTIQRCTFLIFCLLFFVSQSPANDLNPLKRTTTLLPDSENGWQNDSLPSYLSIRNPVLKKNDDPNKQRKAIHLNFNLNKLPKNITAFNACSLRIVAKKSEPSRESIMSVTGSVSPDPKPVISLSDLNFKEKNTYFNLVGFGSDMDLCTKIEEIYKTQVSSKSLELILETDSDNTGALFYSTKSNDDNPSNIPRLVIEFSQDPDLPLQTASWSQHQHNPEHTGRTPWKPFAAPDAFQMKAISIPIGKIVDYPLIFQNKLYLISKDVETNYLLCLDFLGKEYWRKNIGSGVVQSSPAISNQGIIYVVTENKIAAYNLLTSGEPIAQYTLPKELNEKLSAYTDITIGNDGSIFLALIQNNRNIIQGFANDLKPFLKIIPASELNEKISSITVSANGDKLYAQTANQALVVNIANPGAQYESEARSNSFSEQIAINVPIAGPANNMMIVSDTHRSAQSARIRALADDNDNALKNIWNQSGGPMPQAVLGSQGDIYYLTNGNLYRHKYNEVGASTQVTSDDKLNATSNLLIDGADNVYFWDNGTLIAYLQSTNKLIRQDFTQSAQILNGYRALKIPKITDDNQTSATKESIAPEQFVRLMLGPDGTIWANNQNDDKLFAFKPIVKDEINITKQDDVKPMTYYRTENNFTAAAIKVNFGTQLIFQSGKRISLGRGFKVERGASLIVQKYSD